jgi:hypothetical protein
MTVSKCLFMAQLEDLNGSVYRQLCSGVNGCFRGKHEVYDRLLTGTQVDFQ